MRRLLVKLVAIETALVGWLAYWIFLVYSTNPLVSGGLASQLSRFPQVSFTTVDITVLVLIGALSILLAFKFDRGLKPGIRLERALQMLESLMKRNLMLEAQITEMKMASVQDTVVERQGPSEPPLGSWERAFRTPIEAGPSAGANVPGKSGRISNFESPRTETPPPRYKSSRTELRQPPPNPPSPARAAKVKPDTNTQPQEDIPQSGIQTAAESTGNWSPESATSDNATKSVPPVATSSARKSTVIAQPGSRRQPYIPIPAARMAQSPPPSPSVSPISRRGSNRPATAQSVSDLQTENSNPFLPSSYQVGDSESTATAANQETTKSVLPPDYEGTQEESFTDEVPSSSKASGRSSTAKKRFPWEDP